MLKPLLILPFLTHALALTIEVRQDSPSVVRDADGGGAIGAPTPVNPIADSSTPAQGAIGPPTPVNPIADSSTPAQGAIGPPTPVNPIADSSTPAQGAIGPPTPVQPIADSSTPAQGAIGPPTPVNPIADSSTPAQSASAPPTPVEPIAPSSAPPLIAVSSFTPIVPDSSSAIISPVPIPESSIYPSPPAASPPTPPPSGDGDDQNDGYPYPSVVFTNDWPAEFKTGETVHMEWTGGSGRVDVWWLQSWKDGHKCYTQQYYFLRNESYGSYDFYFSPAGCWKRDASFHFGVQEGDVQAGSVAQRDHDTGPLQYLFRGPDDDYNEC